jgi:hypothetical protein
MPDLWIEAEDGALISLAGAYCVYPSAVRNGYEIKALYRDREVESGLGHVGGEGEARAILKQIAVAIEGGLKIISWSLLKTWCERDKSYAPNVEAWTKACETEKKGD